MSSPAITTGTTRAIVAAAASAVAGWLAARATSGTERERLLRAATHDQLTGLPNRTGWTDNLQPLLAWAQRNQRPVVVGLADLDNFKTVNDTLGHATGDVILTAAAHHLRRTIRSPGIVARLGGDEFAILLIGPPRTPNQQFLEHAAGQLHDTVRHTADVHGTQHELSLSLGLAPVLPDTGDIDEAMAHADWAMYQVKQARNKIAVYSN